MGNLSEFDGGVVGGENSNTLRRETGVQTLSHGVRSPANRVEHSIQARISTNSGMRYRRLASLRDGRTWSLEIWTVNISMIAFNFIFHEPFVFACFLICQMIFERAAKN